MPRYPWNHDLIALVGSLYPEVPIATLGYIEAIVISGLDGRSEHISNLLDGSDHLPDHLEQDRM
jgi:hypothetical protein